MTGTSRHMSWLAAVTIAVSFLTGCPTPDPPIEDGGPPEEDAGSIAPLLQLGIGEASWGSFADGQTLELVTGGQGAQHVWVSLRAEGIDRRGPIVNVEFDLASDGARLSQFFEVRVSLQPVAGQIYNEVAGLIIIVPEPDLAIGFDLILRASVTDMNGVVVTDERPVRIEWNLSPPPD